MSAAAIAASNAQTRTVYASPQSTNPAFANQSGGTVATKVDSLRTP